MEVSATEEKSFLAIVSKSCPCSRGFRFLWAVHLIHEQLQETKSHSVLYSNLPKIIKALTQCFIQWCLGEKKNAVVTIVYFLGRNGINYSTRLPFAGTSCLHRKHLPLELHNLTYINKLAVIYKTPKTGTITLRAASAAKVVSKSLALNTFLTAIQS